MSDISAVVLTLGEPSTERAIRSVERQEGAVADVIVVESTTPFHAAFNEGVGRVRTDFFLQVDADMRLHESCARQLRAAMTPKTAVAIGGLRDPLSGVEAGIKLYRLESLRDACLEESISPDTEHYPALRRRGWKISYVVSSEYGADSLWPALGEHKPDYTARYTYTRFYRLGARYAFRRDPVGLQWRFRMLRRSRHPGALRAEFALGHGLFSGITEDFLEPPSIEAELAQLERLQDDDGEETAGEAPALEEEPEAVFKRCYALGRQFREAGRWSGMERLLRQLDQAGTQWDWIARAALCHGALAADGDDPERGLSTVRALVSGDPRTGH